MLTCGRISYCTLFVGIKSFDFSFWSIDGQMSLPFVEQKNRKSTITYDNDVYL